MFSFSSGLKINDAVRLTPVGKSKAQNCGDGAQYRVLDALNENGGVATIAEIARDARLSERDASKIASKLIQSGYITRQRGEL